MGPSITTLSYGGTEAKTVHLAHPGIIMRGGAQNPWPKRHAEEHIPALKKQIDEMKRYSALYESETMPLPGWWKKAVR